MEDAYNKISIRLSEKYFGSITYCLSILTLLMFLHMFFLCLHLKLKVVVAV